MRNSLAGGVVLGFCLVCLTASADEPNGVRISLFNGQNLDGWHVTGCKAAAENGAIVIQEGNGLLRTDHQYRDFVLELSWRARKAEAWDSGIYIRASLPDEGKPWPAKYQINLKQGDEGNIGPLPKARSKGLVKAGDWNRFRVTVIGTTAKLEINGKPAWEADGIEQPQGYIGLQCEAPGGGQFEFKDIYVTELGYRALFDGKSLAGWEGAGQDAAACWKAEDGLLMCTGEKGPWLRSKEQFGDFDLRLEYKLKPGGNSGVYVRVPEDGNHHGDGAGVEIQILDDKAEKYKDLKGYQYTGGVYDISPPREHVGRDPGQWNSLEIEVKGPHYIIVHNGVTIVDADVTEFPDLKGRRLEGFLGLQNHSEDVWYRNVRILTAK
jgi:Domain of Unknown Function (DUF1080)